MAPKRIDLEKEFEDCETYIDFRFRAVSLIIQGVPHAKVERYIRSIIVSRLREMLLDDIEMDLSKKNYVKK